MAAGTSYQRPPSARVPGKGYYDTTLGKFVDSNGTNWQDRVGPNPVGNLLPIQQAIPLMVTTPGYYAASLGTLSTSRAIVPPGRTRSLELVSTGAGVPSILPATQPVVTPGTTYSLACRWVYAAATARSVQLSIWWYDGGTFLSASTGAAVSSGSGVWTNLSTGGAIISAAAPATATQALLHVNILAVAAAGETFYSSDFCFAPGVITDYIEP